MSLFLRSHPSMTGAKHCCHIYWVLLGLFPASIGNTTPTEIIVRYSDHAPLSAERMERLYQLADPNHSAIQVTRPLPSRRMEVWKWNVPPQNLNEKLETLRSQPEITYIQPNTQIQILPIETSAASPLPAGIHTQSPFRCVLPGLYPPGCTNEEPALPALLPSAPLPRFPVRDPGVDRSWGLTRINAAQAWSRTQGEKITVAVIDTGIDYNHEDLSSQLLRQWVDGQETTGFDFIHDDTLPYDEHSHGTHCAGIIGATHQNGVGVAGVATQVRLMALKFMDASGQGKTSDAIRAIDYALKSGARILSNSWGTESEEDNPALQEAMDSALQAGALVIAAAGNRSSDIDSQSKLTFPAAFSHPNLISVAATNEDGQLASFSNWGRNHIHLAAPGTRIYSSMPNDQYGVMSGTSMAAPFVASVAAWIWSQNPGWDFAQVKAKVLSQVRPLPSLKDKVVTGGELYLRAESQSSP